MKGVTRSSTVNRVRSSRETLRKLERVHGAAHARNRRARSIRLQLGGRRSVAQLFPPVLEMRLAGAPVEPLALPEGIVGVLHAEGRKGHGLTQRTGVRGAQAP